MFRLLSIKMTARYLLILCSVLILFLITMAIIRQPLVKFFFSTFIEPSVIIKDYVDKGDFSSALRLGKKIEKSRLYTWKRESWIGHKFFISLAQLHYQLNNPKISTAYLIRAKELSYSLMDFSPYAARVYLNLALLGFQEDKWTQARNYFLIAYDLNPGLRNDLLKFINILKAKPGSDRFLFYTGQFLEIIKNNKEAERAYLNLRQRNFIHPEFYLILGRYYLKGGSRKKAQELFIEQIKKYPASVNALLELEHLGYFRGQASLEVEEVIKNYYRLLYTSAQLKSNHGRFCQGYWVLNKTDDIEIDVPEEVIELAIIARGRECYGVWPLMTIKNNDKTLAEFYVNAPYPRAYHVVLPEKLHGSQLRIVFPNNAYNVEIKKDRQLHIKSIYAKK